MRSSREISSVINFRWRNEQLKPRTFVSYGMYFHAQWETLTEEMKGLAAFAINPAVLHEGGHSSCRYVLSSAHSTTQYKTRIFSSTAFRDLNLALTFTSDRKVPMFLLQTNPVWQTARWLAGPGKYRVGSRDIWMQQKGSGFHTMLWRWSRLWTVSCLSALTETIVKWVYLFFTVTVGWDRVRTTVLFSSKSVWINFNILPTVHLNIFILILINLMH